MRATVVTDLATELHQLTFHSLSLGSGALGASTKMSQKPPYTHWHDSVDVKQVNLVSSCVRRKEGYT